MGTQAALMRAPALGVKDGAGVVGNNLVFAAGEYGPGTYKGQTLLSLIEVHPGLRGLPRHQQGIAHKAMPNHQGSCCSLFLGQREELRCELAHHIAVERDIIGDPEAVKDSKQQQRLIEWFSDRLCLLHQQPCALGSSLRFWRGKPLDMDKRSYETDLKLDLFAAERGR
jgi:hypothetical protein